MISHDWPRRMGWSTPQKRPPNVNFVGNVRCCPTLRSQSSCVIFGKLYAAIGVSMSVAVATFSRIWNFVSTGFGCCLVAKFLDDAVVCLFFLSVDLTVSLRTVAVPWKSAYYDDSCTGVVMAVATATPPTGAMDTKTITRVGQRQGQEAKTVHALRHPPPTVNLEVRNLWSQLGLFGRVWFR